MLTLRIIMDDGSESIYQTRNVLATPSDKVKPYVIEKVWFQTDEGAEIELLGQGAMVYVMNDNGKTVANYDLSYSKPQEMSG
jgi:hypothetical protein